jgi:uncharacterized protein with HEPN domain
LSSKKKSLTEFIQHILIGIEKIERHTKDLDQSGFLKTIGRSLPVLKAQLLHAKVGAHS